MKMKSSNKLGIMLVVFLIIIGVGFIIYNRIEAGNVEKRDKKKEKIVVDEDTNFDIRIIKEVNKDNQENYLISPYSIRRALSMLAEGANNETEKEILDLIGSNKNLITPVKKRINEANGIFIKNKYKKVVNKYFVDTIKEDYKGEVLFDKFEKPTIINEWVKKQTYEMIPKLLDNMSEDFVLGIANAIAIDVEWAEQFDCYATEKATFIKVLYYLMQHIMKMVKKIIKRMNI